MWNRNKHNKNAIQILKCEYDFSISDVSVRELLHFIFDAGSVVYNYNLQDRIVSIESVSKSKSVYVLHILTENIVHDQQMWFEMILFCRRYVHIQNNDNTEVKTMQTTWQNLIWIQTYCDKYQPYS